MLKSLIFIYIMQEILIQHSFNLNSILFFRIFLENFNFASFYVTKLSFNSFCKNKMLIYSMSLALRPIGNIDVNYFEGSHLG